MDSHDEPRSGGNSNMESWHRVCSLGRMMAMLHITLALIAAGLVVELFAASTKSLGPKDEHTFLGSEKADAGNEVHSGNPS